MTADDEAIKREVAVSLGRIVGMLQDSGAKDEALGILRQSRGFSIFKTAPVMIPAGRAWRLGVLLLDRHSQLYSTGEVTRAVEPGRAATNRSDAGELRRSVRTAAARGPFDEGEVVNYYFVPISLDVDRLRDGSGPLSTEGDTVMVRWDDGLGSSPLDAYLTERATLLAEGT
jgi:hypothetical protein